MKVGDTLQVTFARKGTEVNTSHALLPKPESANDHDKSLALEGPVGVAVDRIERELKAGPRCPDKCWDQRSQTGPSNWRCKTCR